MIVTLLLAADYANVAQGGKLNVMGIFDNIQATSFPARHSMHLVVKLAAEFGESEGPREVTIKLLDQDGGEVMNITQQVQVPPMTQGRRPEINFIGELRDLMFPQPGTYEFVVLVDRDAKAHLPINLIPFTPPQNQQPQ